MTKRAKEWFHRVQTGTIDRTQLDAGMNAAFTSDKVKAAAAQIGALGAPQTFTYLKTVVSGDFTTTIYRLTFPKGAALWTFSLDRKGLVAGFYVRPDGSI